MSTESTETNTLVTIQADVDGEKRTFTGATIQEARKALAAAKRAEKARRAAYSAAFDLAIERAERNGYRLWVQSRSPSSPWRTNRILPQDFGVNGSGRFLRVVTAHGIVEFDLAGYGVPTHTIEAASGTVAIVFESNVDGSRVLACGVAEANGYTENGRTVTKIAFATIPDKSIDENTFPLAVFNRGPVQLIG